MLTIGGFTIQSPQILGLAFLGGTIPALLWLFFWMREIKGNRQPKVLMVTTFFAGMLCVVIVLPIQKLIAGAAENTIVLTTLWAASEEIIKCLAFIVIMSKSPYLDKPAEYPIYFMTAALGFAALENTLFLIQPLSVDNTTLSLITGNMRFLGSTLLHAAASGMIGIAIGLAFFKSASTRAWYTLIGIAAAITLHSIFNFFIMKENGENFLQVFGFLWVTTIIIMLLFEKLRRMGSYVTTPSVKTPDTI